MENEFQVPGFKTDGIHLIPQWFYGREGRMKRGREREREIEILQSISQSSSNSLLGEDFQVPLPSFPTPNRFAFPKPISSKSVSQVEHRKL